MKRFLKKLLFFVIGMLGINLVINLIVPYTIQDERFEERYVYLQKHLDQYNTLFFGSSRTLRHVIPSLFDSINAQNGIHSKSFNLGTPANRLFETYAQYEYFLKSYGKSNKGQIKKVYIEIFPMTPIEPSNLFSRKSSYWLTYGHSKELFSFLQAGKISVRQKIAYRNTFAGFLIRHLGFNYINIAKEKNKDSKVWLGANLDGYIDYEDEINEISDLEQKQKLVAFKTDFAKDTTVLVKRKQKVEKEFEKDDKEFDKANSVHVKKIKNLIKISKDNGIDLKFIVQPRLASYDELRALKNVFPNEIFMIANPLQYKELWSVKQSFDASHLNKEASRLYTKILGEMVAH